MVGIGLGLLGAGVVASPDLLGGNGLKGVGAEPVVVDFPGRRDGVEKQPVRPGAGVGQFANAGHGQRYATDRKNRA